MISVMFGMQKIIVPQVHNLCRCSGAIWRHSSTSSKLCNSNSSVQHTDTIPEKFNFARDVFDKWLEHQQVAKECALWFVSEDGFEKKWSYQHLSKSSQKLASAISTLGVARRILLMLPRVPELWITNLAAMRAGSILFPCTTRLMPQEIKYRIQEAKPDYVITDIKTAVKIDELESNKRLFREKILVTRDRTERPGWINYYDLRDSGSLQFPSEDTRTEDIVQVFFTSGTTGYPKMVPYTYTMIGFGLQHVTKKWFPMRNLEVQWSLSDTGWVRVLQTSIVPAWSNGATVFVHEMPIVSPTSVAQTLSTYPITQFSAPPVVFRDLLQLDLTKYKLTHLKQVFSGGEAVTENTAKQWKTATGLDLREAYSQTELCVPLGYFEDDLVVKPGTVGKPSSSYDLQILDENLQQLPSGIEGNIAINVKAQWPAGLFRGYYNAKETASCFKGDYYLTGDRGYIDNEGYYIVTGRADDVLNVAGFRIGPTEVENVLSEHPAVKESAAVSSSDNGREVIKAFVVLSDKYRTEDQTVLTYDLQQHMKERSAAYKCPKQFEFVDALPKTPTMKIQRNLLREREKCEKNV